MTVFLYFETRSACNEEQLTKDGRVTVIQIS
jgi:hypothetical protein